VPDVVEVVREPHLDAAGGGVLECLDEYRADGIRQPDVVDRDLERVLCGRDPVGENSDDLLGSLAPVGEGANFDQEALAARIAALCARLAA
jgi:hypothetical protein